MAQRSSRQRKTVPNIPEAPIAAPSIVDGKADAEAKALANSTLEQEAARSDHERNLSTKNALHRAAIGVFFFWVFIYLSFVTVWGYHFIFPPTWHYLDPSQVGNLQSFVLSGTVAAALTKYFKA